MERICSVSQLFYICAIQQDHHCTSLKVLCDRTWNISTSALNAEQLTVKADRWLSSVLSFALAVTTMDL